MSSDALTWEEAAESVAVEILAEGNYIVDLADFDESLAEADTATAYSLLGVYALKVARINEDVLVSAKEYMAGVLTTVIAKQIDYGHGNILRHGITGVNVRMCDKVERIKNLQKRGGEAVNEPLADSWLDLVGYSIIAVMLLDGTFELPLSADIVDEPTEDGHGEPWTALPYGVRTCITHAGHIYNWSDSIVAWVYAGRENPKPKWDGMDF